MKAFKVGDVVAPSHAMHVLYRVDGTGESLGEPWYEFTPCRKDGQRDMRRNRIGFTGGGKGFVLVRESQ